MKVLHVVAGAGGMYCGSCLHGNTLAAALRRAGCDAILVPAYTPLRTDEENVSIDRVVYGGVNVYLQQASALFRHTPRLLDRLLDRPALLRRLGRRGSATRPAQLGPLAVSMLRGEQGRQRKELDKLVDWLARDVRPDLVHLNNAMLSGMAREIHRRLGIPVVCDLSGEDSFVEKLPEPYHSEARAVLRERCGELAAMVAMNGYFADFMAGYLSVPRERIHVIPPGLDLDGFPAPGASPDPESPEQRSATPRACEEMGTGSELVAPKPAKSGRPEVPVPIPSQAPTIGFLGRVCPDKGLHLLAEAVALLAEAPGMAPVRLEAAGYLAPGDRAYLAEIEAGLQRRGLADRFRYHGELDRLAKIAFLRSLAVLSAPAVFPEAKGLPVLEAWAAGTPVVAAGHGAFPELIEDTGGGLLHAPHDAAALAAALEQLIQNPQHAAECARRGHQAVHERYHAARMARRTIELYEKVCAAENTPGAPSRKRDGGAAGSSNAMRGKPRR